MKKAAIAAFFLSLYL